MIWIAWVMNMVNWSKGVDGQMPGIVIIAAVILALVSLKFLPADPRQLVVAKIALIVAGATFGFLIYNFYPAKIFPGYGATILGFFLATLAILASGKLATAILVLAVPFADGVVTIFRRVWLGKSPFKGDRAHLHHLLLNYGFSQKLVALFYWTFCAILGTISLFLKSIEKLFIGVAVGITIAGAVLWLNYLQLGKKKN
jgi:UDP-GlcNAc:undecaprenyl-phosphate GlcNAc-1-phosphate transferase